MMQKLHLVNHIKCFVQPLKANDAILLTFGEAIISLSTRATKFLAIEISNVYLKFCLV